MKFDIKNITLLIVIIFVGASVAELICSMLLHLPRHTYLFSTIYTITVMPFMYYYKRYIEYCGTRLSIVTTILFGIIVWLLLFI